MNLTYLEIINHKISLFKDIKINLIMSDKGRKGNKNCYGFCCTRCDINCKYSEKL